MVPDDPTLKNHPVIWRFTDATKYTQLSLEEFKRFRPLSEEDSIKQWKKYIYPLPEPDRLHLLRLALDGHICLPERAEIPSETTVEPEEIAAHLQRHIPANYSEPAVFFWFGDLAVEIDWGLFLDHWDDFCYPTDDSNIVVIPELNKAVAYIDEAWFILEKTNSSTSFPLFENK